MLSRKLIKPLIALIWIGVAQAFCVLALYFYKFAPGNWFTLSSSHEVWAQFGDFFGGALNPMLSFLAFTGLVVTITLQMRQIDDGPIRDRLDQLRALAISVSATIDSILKSLPAITAPDVPNVRGLTALPMFQLLAAFGIAQKLSDEAEKGLILEYYSKIKPDIGPSILTLCLEFESLSWIILKYAEAGGNADLRDFFIMRHLAVVSWLESLGQFEVHGAVRKVFNLEVRP